METTVALNDVNQPESSRRSPQRVKKKKNKHKSGSPQRQEPVFVEAPLKRPMPSAAEIATSRSDDDMDPNAPPLVTPPPAAASPGRAGASSPDGSPSKQLLERQSSNGLPRSSLSKREQIRQRLREKEKQLSRMISSAPKSPISAQGYNGRSGFVLESPVPRQGDRIIQTVGKDEADRREAIRILSSSALKMKESLKKQRQKTKQLQDEFGILQTSLSGKENDKAKLENDLKKLREEHEESQQRLVELHRSNDEKSMQISQNAFDEQESQLQSQLAAAHEEVSWTQKDSMSKAEQIEYFEYQLLSKNHEIDDLRQELNCNTRRIVELEVDLEIHDDRFVTSMDMYSRTAGSVMSGTMTSSPSSVGDMMMVRNVVVDTPESVTERSTPTNSRKPRRSLVQVLSQGLRRKNSMHSARSLASGNIVEDTGSCASSQFQIEKMQSDISNLEARYKKDKCQSRMQIEQLKQDNDEYVIKVLSLEKSLQNQQGVDEEVDENGEKKVVRKEEETLPTKAHFLQERVEKLETARDLDSRTIDNLRAHITRLEGEVQQRGVLEEQELKQLQLENQVKETKLCAMERDLGEATQNNNRSLKGLHINAAAGLEAKLQDNVLEVIRLRKEQEVKDKKIDTLRSEIIELRLLRMQFEKAAHGKGSAEGGSDSSMPLEAIEEAEPTADAHTEEPPLN